MRKLQPHPPSPPPPNLAAALAYQNILDNIVELAEASHELAPEFWPGGFLAALARVNLAYLLGQRQPLAWLEGYRTAFNEAVKEWVEGGGGRDQPLN